MRSVMKTAPIDPDHGKRAEVRQLACEFDNHPTPRSIFLVFLSIDHPTRRRKPRSHALTMYDAFDERVVIGSTVDDYRSEERPPARHKPVVADECVVAEFTPIVISYMGEYDV